MIPEYIKDLANLQNCKFTFSTINGMQQNKRTKKSRHSFDLLFSIEDKFFLFYASSRHKNYKWGVLEVHQEDPSIFYAKLDALNVTDPCSHPDTIKCGHTGNVF